MKNTIAILSGGMDSTVLAHYLHEQGCLVGCMTVNYGQRHVKETTFARATAERLGVPFYYIDLSQLRGHIASSALTSAAPVPEGHYAAETMKQTVVPNRNMILLSLAVGVAISNGADGIAYGAHAGDHAIYPDCREEFTDAMKAAIKLCDWEPPELFAPFNRLTKDEVVAIGLRLGVPFDQTWTCYNGGDVACGRCGTCVERLEAFSICGKEDPLPYQDRDYFHSVTK